MVTCYSLNREIRHLERSFHLSSTQGGLSPPLTTLGDYQPLERIITSPLVDFGLLHQYVEKSDLLSIFGVLHPLPLFPTIILV